MSNALFSIGASEEIMGGLCMQHTAKARLYDNDNDNNNDNDNDNNNNNNNDNDEDEDEDNNNNNLKSPITYCIPCCR